MADHGTRKDLQKPGRSKSVTTEDKQLELAQATVENPQLSLRREDVEYEQEMSSL